MMLNQQVCRCCLRENAAHTYDIFDVAAAPVCITGRTSQLCEVLLACVPKLHIEPDDGLPDVICDECWQRLREMLDFRHRCEESERELRCRYADTERAIEEALKLVHMLDTKSSPNAEQTPTQVAEQTITAEDTNSFSTDLSLLDNLLLGDATLDGLLDTEEATPPRVVEAADGMTYALLGNYAAEAHTSNTPPSCDSYVPPTASVDSDIGGSSNFTPPLPLPPPPPPPPPLNTSSPDSAYSSTPPTSVTKSTRDTPKSLHPCPECEKKFTRNFQLKLHLISVHKHGDGLQYKCEQCAKSFASRHSLSYHQKSVHSAERPFACPHCERRFVLRTQLSSHARVHTGEAKPRIYECLECGKRWPTKSDLRTHMRRHVTALERPFKCSECSKAFFTRGHLSSHVLVHTGEKPFACAYCDKSYQCVGNLNNHMVRHHPDMVVGGGARNRVNVLENVEL